MHTRGALLPTLLLLIASALAATPARAQDSHYWTQVFGSRSGLLGGTNIGAPDDTSATFYNPGAIGFQRPGTLGVSANAYQVQRASVSSGAGESLDLDSEEVNVIPLAIAGTFAAIFSPIARSANKSGLVSSNVSSSETSIFSRWNIGDSDI